MDTEIELEDGTKVRTDFNLASDQESFAYINRLDNRQADVDGEITEQVDTPCGVVYYIEHEDNTIAPYARSEFKLV